MDNEKRIAILLKGRKTRASGALPQDKGDIVANHKLKLVIQYKKTKNNKFYVTTKLLDKCIRDAISRNPDYHAGLCIFFSESQSLCKNIFMVQENFLYCLNLNIKMDIINRAIEYKMKSIVIQPDSCIYKLQDDKHRVWYIIPALYYRWI